jgi:hypothetical protein
MANWTPERSYEFMTGGEMTNNNIVAGGILTLRKVGQGKYELGYDNNSGHYLPGADALWNAQVRTALNGLAAKLSEIRGEDVVEVRVGMQTNQILP